MFFYSVGLLAVLILASPYWLFRMLFSGRYRDGLGQRLGLVPQGLRAFLAGRESIWIHAVSVGEVLAIGRLVEMLQAIDPNLPVIVSTTTRAGQQLARERWDKSGAVNTRVFYYPLDFAWIVRRYLRALRPRVLVLVESEMWPRMLVEASRADIPVVIVNGRISDRSLPRYRALRRLWRPFLQRLSRVLAQSEQDRQRFIAIGVPPAKVETAGNLKYDVRAAEALPLLQVLVRNLPAGAQILVAGSTVEDEEMQLLRAFQPLASQFPSLVLLLAPRHPQRFAAVADLVRSSGLPWVRRSSWMQHPRAIAPGSVFLLDSIGELASVYSLATVAFVGGSLVPSGGHNPLEPAQFAVPIVMGPHTENFRGMVATLLEQDAICITPPERLEGALRNLLATAAGSQTGLPMGLRARQVFQRHTGASEQCLDAIRSYLEDSAVPRDKKAGQS